MRTMFLVGDGIAHSLSPAMWNQFFSATGRDIEYGLRDVGEGGLADVLTELRSGSVFAANVTMPYKAWAAASSDRRSPTVEATDAANLLVPRAGVLESENTDVAGARSILEARAPFESVLVLGAGGTSMSLLEALAGLATNVAITNRTPERATSLADRYSRRFASITAFPWAERDDLVVSADLVVSTVPAVDASPVDVSRLRSHALVYDAVYRSQPTHFQAALASRGVPVADGLTHLAAQAIGMLEPLGFSSDQARLLVAGLEKATERQVTAWGAPLV